MIDEAGESSGARYSISASNGSYVERSCLVRSADFVQQRPRVLHVQAGEILEKSTLPETHCSEHLSSHYFRKQCFNNTFYQLISCFFQRVPRLQARGNC